MPMLNPKHKEEPEHFGPLTDQELRMWVIAAATKCIAGGSPIETLLAFSEAIYKFVNPPPEKQTPVAPPR